MQELSKNDIEIIKKECSKKIPTGPTEKLSKSQLAFYKESMNIIEIGKKIDTLSEEKQSAYIDRVQAMIIGLNFGSQPGDPTEKPNVKCTQVCSEIEYQYPSGGVIFLVCVIICVFTKLWDWAVS